MKTNEAPEKIYLFENPISGTPDDRWLSKRSDENDIEYIRTDVFIEKATQFINDKLQGKRIEWRDEYCWSLGSFIKQFKQTIEGE